VLLHYEDDRMRLPWMTWPHWLEAAGAEGLVPRGALRFSQYDQTIHAAIDGQGVALGTSPLVRQLIRQGRLIAPLAKKFESSRAYFLVTSANAAGRPDVQDFAAWLLRQAKQEAPARSGRRRQSEAGT
jgi:DNA-binding transcriptional LysR family regulator